MITRKKRTVIAVALSLIMALAYMPCSAFATENDTQDIVSEADAPEGFQENETIMPEIEQDENLSAKNIKLPDSDVLLENYLVQEASREAKASAVGVGKNTRGKRLTGNNAAVYNYLKDEISQIADGAKDSSEILIPMSELAGGKEYWTASDLGVENILVDYTVPDDVVPALVDKYRFDIDPVLNALLADLPYDMYWFDKKKGIYAQINDPGGLSLCRDPETGEWAVKWEPENGWMTKLYVSKEYSASHAASTTDVDVSKTATAKTAAANAGTIVGNNKSKTDLAKLTAYKDAICNLAAYDSDGLNVSSPDDNLWQMIYVFDNVSSTNVVCEGYSKAFQFLCDITEFDSARIESHLVSGVMTGGTGAGSHMWNIVHMSDNRNYIVDVTNCDTGTIGYPDYLFIKKTKSGSVANGYKYSTAGSDISYTYDQDTFDTYDTDELTMSATAYAECNHSWGSGAITKQPSCVEEGIRTYTCSRCGDIRTEIISTTDHTNGDPVRENEVAASCTAEGSYEEVVYCTECNTELSRETKTIDKLQHTPGEPARENEHAASCTAAGSYDEVVYCTKCNAELSREPKTINKIAHTPGDPVRENERAASCTAEGSYDEVIYCTKCNAELSRETKTIDKLNHTSGDPVRENERAASCTAEGSYDEVVYCTKCNTELSREAKTIGKLDHTPGDPVRENEIAASYTEEGSYDEVIYCTKCNAELSREAKTIDKLSDTPGGDTPGGDTPGGDPQPAKTSIDGAQVVLSQAAFIYNANVQKPTIKTIGGAALTEGTDYTAAWSNNASRDAGTYKVTVTGTGDYEGTAAATYVINKAANPMTVKGKTAKVKFSKLKKKAQTVKRTAVLAVAKNQGSVTYVKSSGNKKITINKTTGKVKVKKGLKKGTYKVKVKVTAAGNANYNPNTLVRKITIRVK